MNKRNSLLTTATLLSAFIIATPAYAKRNKHKKTYKEKQTIVIPQDTCKYCKDFYVKLEGGSSIPNKKKNIKRWVTTGAGIGYSFNKFFRGDAMLHYKHMAYYAAPIKNTNTFGATVNGYVDAHNSTGFIPYVMIGAGYGVKKHDYVVARDSKSVKTLTLTTGLGCQAKVYDQVTLDLGYRYVDLGKIQKNTKKRLHNHEVVVGLVYDL